MGNRNIKNLFIKIMIFYLTTLAINIYIYIYAFSRRFYPKRLTLHSSYSFYILSALLRLLLSMKEANGAASSNLMISVPTRSV